MNRLHPTVKGIIIIMNFLYMWLVSMSPGCQITGVMMPWQIIKINIPQNEKIYLRALGILIVIFMSSFMIPPCSIRWPSKEMKLIHVRCRLTMEVTRPSRRPGDEKGRERRSDHGILGNSCGWVRVERRVSRHAVSTRI